MTDESWDDFYNKTRKRKSKKHARKVRTRKKDSIYDRIKKSLKNKDNGELQDFWIGANHGKDWPGMTRTELIEEVTDIILRQVPRTPNFSVERYFETLFKGRQKGRAYRSFREH